MAPGGPVFALASYAPAGDSWRRRSSHGGKRQVLLTGYLIHFSALRRMSENDLGVNIGMF